MPTAFIAAAQTTLFEGSEGCRRSPRHHVEALEDGSFKVIGQLMVMSILHEGPPPAFLAEWVYTYLCTPDVAEIKLADDDIINPDIKTLVKRVISLIIIIMKLYISASGEEYNLHYLPLNIIAYKQYKNKKLFCVLPEPDDNTAKIRHFMYYVLCTAKFHLVL